MSVDGLQALTAQRDQAKARSSRHLPPPRHASKKRVEQVDPTRTETAVPDAAPIPTDAPTSQTVESTDLVRATAYLLPVDDEWLNTVAQRGRRGKPRVDASRSAVIRFALERLRAQLEPEEIVAELRARAARPAQGVGRKRL